MKRNSSEKGGIANTLQKFEEQEESHSSDGRSRPTTNISPPAFPSRKQQRTVFEMLPIGKFSKTSPFFRQPVEIGGFSLDKNRQFIDNRQKLKEYVTYSSEVLDFDLRIGYESFISRDENVKERLDHLLAWINLHRDEFKLPGECETNSSGSLNTDFITWRGHLSKILCTPYETKEPWQFDACKFNGTIFISEVETEARKMQRCSQTEKQNEMCYWGYKFEDYMTKPFGNSAAAESTSQTRGHLNNSEGFCSVVRSRLNNHSFVIGAEVDCCSLISGKVKAPESYVELKTSRIMEHPNQRRNFSRFKLRKFWAQSYLAGVPKIVCGMRDDNGIVRKLVNYKTLDIPRIASSNNGGWSGAICMNFCDSFLQWVKDTVIEDDPRVVYSFRFDEPFTSITVQKQKTDIAMFMPDWFISKEKHC